VRPTYIVDRRAVPSVLAVQTVPVEENEVYDRRPFHRLVDTEEPLYGCGRPTLGLGLELSQANDAGCVDRRPGRPSPRSASRLRPATLRALPGSGGRLSRLLRTARTLASRRRHPCRARPCSAGTPAASVPPLLDFRHANPDNQLQM